LARGFALGFGGVALRVLARQALGTKLRGAAEHGVLLRTILDRGLGAVDGLLRQAFLPLFRRFGHARYVGIAGTRRQGAHQSFGALPPSGRNAIAGAGVRSAWTTRPAFRPPPT